MGVGAAGGAAEAVTALYRPALLLSAGFAGALDPSLHVADILIPAAVIDARDSSRVTLEGANGEGLLVTFMAVARVSPKSNLGQTYNPHARDMEAAGGSVPRHAPGTKLSARSLNTD